MAGLGFKDFAVGEVLTSSDVDSYLMQQTVMRFADSGARGSALGTAAGTGVAIAEGMVTYLDDLNDVQVYNGTAWGSIGKIKQIVTATTTTQTTTSGSSYTDTSLSASITPQTADSKVLVLAAIGNMFADTSSAIRCRIALFRGATELNAEARKSGDADSGGASLIILDSPATASSVTYKVRVKLDSGAATVGVRDRQNMILVEIANV